MNPMIKFLIAIIQKLKFMPITRPNSKQTHLDKTDFERSVEKNPMAMSMMIDSVVNMMQNTRPSLHQEQSNALTSQNGY